MRIGIRSKLVLALLFSNSLLAITMFLISSWRFDQGFTNFLVDNELERLQPLRESLAQTFGQTQSWTPLVENRRLWDRHVSRYMRRYLLPPPLERFQPSPRLPPSLRPPRPEAEAYGAAFGIFDPRITLTDENKNVVIGPQEIEGAEVFWLDIVWNEEIVGYLKLSRYADADTSLDIAFSEEQKNSYVWIALGSLFLAMCIGLVLAIYWLRPIQHMQRALVRLSEGDFSQRLDQTGNDEVADLATRFNMLARTLEESKSVQRQWISDTSHELRTPLAILIAEVEALIDGVRPTNKKQLQSLHDEALHLQSIVEQLHELNMSELGSLSYKFSTHNFASFMKKLVTQFSPICEKEGITFSYTKGSPTANAEIDEQKFKQVFLNLFHNSIRYTDKPGTLSIEWTVLDNELVLEWSDSSPSVNDEEKERLFDRLFRAENSRNRRSGGSGLGLAIVKSIVEAHGGKISVAGSELGGLQFTLRLPAHK